MAPTSARSRTREQLSRARRTEDILTQLDRLGSEPDPGARQDLLDALVCLHMDVAQSIAARYRNRGLQEDDLEQVAYLALVRVSQTYDHSRGHDFMSYAVPSIRGEIRRHFRDRGWMVRPPRRVQDMQARIRQVQSELCTWLGRPPNPEELACELGESVADVVEALAANGCFSPTSLDQAMATDETTSMGDQIGEPERGWEAAEARVLLADVVRQLTDQ